jgi:hypothetical protein
MGYVDSPTSDIQILKTFMKIAIAQEHALHGAELLFVCVEWAESWPTCTSKSTKAIIVKFFMEEML